MTEQISTEVPPKKTMSSLPILIGLGLIIGFGAIFLFEFLQLSRPSGGLDEESITADAYLADVTPLLENADPERGRQLVSAKGCVGCHANNLAPSYAETHQQSGNRRSPMTAQGYLYESILFPNAFKAGDYPTNMPMNYVDSLTSQEIGDIIAYLLSPLAEAP